METVFAATRDALEKQFGQRLLVENRPGGGGNLGAQVVLAAPADGYTILVPPANVLVTNPFLYSNMPFDPLRDFAPVTELVELPLVLAVNTEVPAQTLTEFLHYARVHPGGVNYASPGAATPPHLAAAILARAAKLDLVHVPYKGGSAAATALIAGEVQFMIIGYPTLIGPIQSGRIRPLAVAATARLHALPAIPTFAESGHADLEAEIPRGWWGLAVRRGTPDSIIQRLYREFRSALATPEAQKRLRDAGLVGVVSSPEEFARSLPAQAGAWRAMVRALDLRLE